MGLLALSLLFPTIVGADTLSDAIAAKNRGDFETAYPLWVKLAEAGDDKALLEVGLAHYLGRGKPVDYGIAMDWFLRAFRRNGDAVNNIGVMYRDGLGVPTNRKIAYLLFLTVHMTGMGTQSTITRANSNLRREMAELSLEDRQQALCYTMEYVVAYVESKGTLDAVPERLKASPTRKRIRDFNWWQPGEMGAFACSN